MKNRMGHDKKRSRRCYSTFWRRRGRRWSGRCGAERGGGSGWGLGIAGRVCLLEDFCVMRFVLPFVFYGLDFFVLWECVAFLCYTGYENAVSSDCYVVGGLIPGTGVGGLPGGVDLVNYCLCMNDALAVTARFCESSWGWSRTQLGSKKTSFLFFVSLVIWFFLLHHYLKIYSSCPGTVSDQEDFLLCSANHTKRISYSTSAREIHFVIFSFFFWTHLSIIKVSLAHDPDIWISFFWSYSEDQKENLIHYECSPRET